MAEDKIEDQENEDGVEEVSSDGVEEVSSDIPQPPAPGYVLTLARDIPQFHHNNDLDQNILPGITPDREYWFNPEDTTASIYPVD